MLNFLPKQCTKQYFRFININNQRSQKPEEQEVLFNALCSFEVISVTKESIQGLSYYSIKLRYGMSYVIMQKYQKDRSSVKQQQLLLKIISRQQVVNSLDQFDAMCHYDFMFKECLIYAKKALSLWQNVQSNSKLSLLRQLQIFRFSGALYCAYVIKGKLTLEQSIFMKDYQQKQYGIVIEKSNPIIMIFNITSLIGYLIQNCNQKQYRKAERLLQTCKIQFRIWQTVSLYVMSRVQLKSQQEDLAYISKTKQQIDLIQLKIKIGLLQRVEDSGIAEQLQSIKGKIEQKYGRYHPVYLQIQELQNSLKKKQKKQSSEQQMKQSQNVRQTHYNLLQQAKSNLTKGCYDQGIKLIKKYILQNKDAEFGPITEHIAYIPIFQQLNNLTLTLQLGKLTRLMEICKQFDQKSQVLLKRGYEIKQFVQNSIPKILDLMERIIASISQDNSKECLIKLLQYEVKGPEQKQKALQYWIMECLKQNSLRMLGRYAEADLKRSKIIKLLQYSQYKEVIDCFFMNQ